MRHRRALFISGIIFLLNVISCSKSGDISGFFVHYKGLKKYYLLTVTGKGGSNYFVKFEGVPLESYKTTEWAKMCNGKLDGNTIKCDDLLMEFSPATDTVSVNYQKNEKQIFINNKKEIEEEITLYKKGTVQMGKKSGENTQR